MEIAPLSWKSPHRHGNYNIAINDIRGYALESCGYLLTIRGYPLESCGYMLAIRGYVLATCGYL